MPRDFAGRYRLGIERRRLTEPAPQPTCQPEDQASEAARGLAEGQRQAGEDDDDDRDDLGDRALNGFQNLVERLLLRHVRTGRVRRCREKGENDKDREDGEGAPDVQHYCSPAGIRT